MHRLIAITAAACLGTASPLALGYSYQAKTGALSYGFFNLSPDSYTLTPYGGGPNPNGLDAPASSQGWGNADGTVGFFNPISISGGSCDHPSVQVAANPIFYNDTWPGTSAGAAVVLGAGNDHAQVEFSPSHDTLLNAPALGDSWTLSSAGGNQMVIAALGSAPNMFISGIENHSDYPYCASQPGLWYNSGINPPQPQQQTEWSDYYYVSTPAGTQFQATNPIAPGYTAGTLNLNVSPNAGGYVPTGGLWLGMFNPNAANLAVDSLNLAMYPVNLSAYVHSDEVNTGIDQYAAPIYGGHFTLAVGDPFLTSGYAAKMLWFLVTNTGYAFSNQSLTADDIANIQNLVAPAAADGVFAADSISSDYAAWLFASPATAVSTLHTMNQAASQPITQESIWGKVFSGLVDVSTIMAVNSLTLLAGPEASIGVKVAVGAAAATGMVAGSHGLDSYATAQITADFTSTESLPAPVAEDAPPVINASYSASDLLGMLLTNSLVQAEINNQLDLGNPSAFALWSNYTISTDGLCSNIGLTDNLFAATIACGSPSGSPPDYDNVLSLYPNSYSTNRLNLWSAVLTGADISASNGYLQLGNPGTAAFQPPTQLVNRTGAASPVSGVDATFALDTGMVSVAGYAVTQPGTSAASTHPPSLQMVQQGSDWQYWQDNGTIHPPAYSANATDDPGYYFYDADTGLVTATGVWVPWFGAYGNAPQTWNFSPQGFANGSQTLDMTQCAQGSQAVLTVTPVPYSNELDGVFSCSTPLTVTASSAAPAAAPAVNQVVASPIPSGYGIGFIAPRPSQIAYDASTAVLTVTGYQGYSTNVGDPSDPVAYSFINAPDGISLDLTTCTEGSGVNLYLYPMGGQTAADAVGYLTCARGVPAMPYSLCTSDLQATGGVVAGLTQAPASDGTGAAFDLGCACIPSYLGGPAIDSGATTSRPGAASFWQTGTDDGGDPVGLMVGATATNPTGLCN